MKMKGVLSQGLLLPLEDFPETAAWSEANYTGILDQFCEQLQEILGIEKYEPPEQGMPGHPALSTFPTFIPKTDLERCQNLKSELISAMMDMEEFEVTTKLDGSSMTVYVKELFIENGFSGYQVRVCSRNQELQETDGRYWEAAKRSRLLEPMLRFATIHGPFALQGELIGPKVQGNPEGIDHYEFRVFDAYSITQQRYMNPYERGALISDLNRAGAQVLEVPMQHWKATIHGPDPVEYVLFMADGPSLYAGKREGIVYKSHTTGLRFKAISNQYLLAEK